MKIMHDKTELNLICHAKKCLHFCFTIHRNDASKRWHSQKKVSNYHTLRDKVRIANNDSDVVEIAKQSGFTLSTDEIWLNKDRTFKRKVGIRGWYTS